MPVGPTSSRAIEAARELARSGMKRLEESARRHTPGLIGRTEEHESDIGIVWCAWVALSKDGDEVSASITLQEGSGVTTVDADVCYGARLVLEVDLGRFSTFAEVDDLPWDAATADYFREAEPVFLEAIERLKAHAGDAL